MHIYSKINVSTMPSLEDMPLELLAHILSFVPAYVPVRHRDLLQ